METADQSNPARVRRHRRHYTAPRLTVVRCPSCICPLAYRSRYRWYEVPLWLLRLRPFRCSHCYRRFWGRARS
jgi:hypothetical protein